MAPSPRPRPGAPPITDHAEVAPGDCHVRPADAAGRVSRVRRVLLVALLGALLAGCQLRVATDVVVEVDGSGTASVRIVADQELAAALDEAEVDVLDGLDEAAEGADWQATAIDDEELGVGVELTTDFATAEELGQRVAELSAALTTDDGALLRDVELSRTEEGGYVFTATAGIDPPRVVGSLPLDEGDVRFDGDDLAAALADGGDDVARHDLRVTFPTVPVPDAGADVATVETTSVTYALPNDELLTVGATAPPLPVDRQVVLLAAVGVGAALLTALAVRYLRRR